MKLEIGGGNIFAKGEDWINIDLCKEAHIEHNLNILPWPIVDESVDEIYSSHCIEHVMSSIDFLTECARIGKISSKVEIRCPYPYSDMAMTSGHTNVFSLQQAKNMDFYFPHITWYGKRRLKLLSYHINASERLEEAKKELPFLSGLSNEVIMKYIPGTAFESVFVYEVIDNEYYTNKKTGISPG